MCALLESAETLARQNCASISLLHQQAAAQSTAAIHMLQVAASRCGTGIYKCKSCDKAFESFQALGGHRASHNKIRLDSVGPAAARLKVHECMQCRVRFPTGQALGGHMRKHVDSNGKRKRVDDDVSVLEGKENRIRVFPILRESKTSKRVVLELDLNFPPPVEEYSFLQLACVGADF